MTPKEGSMGKVRKIYSQLSKWLLEDEYFDNHRDAMTFIHDEGINFNIMSMLGIGLEIDEIYGEITQFNMDEYLYNKGLPLKFAFHPTTKDDPNIVGSDAYNRKHHMFYYETPEILEMRNKRREEIRRHLNLDN